MELSLLQDTNLREIFSIFIKHFKIIILLTILGGAIVGGYSSLRGNTTYEATAQVLIKFPKTEKGADSEQVNIQMARLISTSSVLLKSNSILDYVVEKMDRKYDYSTTSGALKDATTIVNDQGSQIVSVHVTNSKKKNAILIANSIVKEFQSRIPSLIGLSETTYIPAHEASQINGGLRAKLKVIVSGAFSGFMLSLAIVFYLEFATKFIVDERDISKKYGIRLLGSMDLTTKKG